MTPNFIFNENAVNWPRLPPCQAAIRNHLLPLITKSIVLSVKNHRCSFDIPRNEIVNVMPSPQNCGVLRTTFVLLLFLLVFYHVRPQTAVHGGCKTWNGSPLSFRKNNSLRLRLLRHLLLVFLFLFSSFAPYESFLYHRSNLPLILRKFRRYR